MPNLLTVGPDEVISVWRDKLTHTFKGELLAGGPFDTLFVQFYGARTLQVCITEHTIQGLCLLRDELTRIIDEYKGRCPTCHRKGV